jgi:hypothetical protein
MNRLGGYFYCVRALSMSSDSRRRLCRSHLSCLTPFGVRRGVGQNEPMTTASGMYSRLRTPLASIRAYKHNPYFIC